MSERGEAVVFSVGMRPRSRHARSQPATAYARDGTTSMAVKSS